MLRMTTKIGHMHIEDPERRMEYGKREMNVSITGSMCAYACLDGVFFGKTNAGLTLSRVLVCSEHSMYIRSVTEDGKL